MKQIVFFLSIHALLSINLATAAVTLCPLQNQTEYMNTELSQQCANALTRLQFVLPPPVDFAIPTRNPSDLTQVSNADLDTACQMPCAGTFSTWLRQQCQDPYTARSLDAMCALTRDTTNEIGPRCRFGFPDAFDGRRVFLSVFTQCDFGDPDACVEDVNAETRSDGTGDSMTGDADSTVTVTSAVCRAFGSIIDSFGCCFNSLFNNTEFVGYLSAQGLLNSTMVERLVNLGLSPVWDQCMVDVPPMCEQLSSAPNSVYPVTSVLVLAAIFSLLFKLF